MRLEDLVEIDEDEEAFDDLEMAVITQRGDMRLCDLFDDVNGDIGDEQSCIARALSRH